MSDNATDECVGPVPEPELDQLVEQLKNMGFDEVCLCACVCLSVWLSGCLAGWLSVCLCCCCLLTYALPLKTPAQQTLMVEERSGPRRERERQTDRERDREREMWWREIYICGSIELE